MSNARSPVCAPFASMIVVRALAPVMVMLVATSKDPSVST